MSFTKKAKKVIFDIAKKNKAFRIVFRGIVFRGTVFVRSIHGTIRPLFCLHTFLHTCSFRSHRQIKLR